MAEIDIYKELDEAILSDLEASVKSNTLIDWVNDNRTMKGSPWKWVVREENEFGKVQIKDYRYLLELYNDSAEQIIVKKSRQLAVSEYGINWIMGTIARRNYTTALHIFPNEPQIRKFSMLRLTPLFDRKDSPKISRLLVTPDEQYKDKSALHAAANVYHKQLVNNSSYVLSFIGGANTKSTDARSVSCDIIFLDEAKDLPEEKIADVLECMSQSAIKHMRMVGTPDFEGTVFDMWFNDSDCREWVVTCKECGTEQILSMDNIIPTNSSPFENINTRPSLYYYACSECYRELDRSFDCGKWVPQNPGARTHGYHITQLMASWISADEIMEKKAKYAKHPQKFANEVLGEVYAGGTKPITLTKLQRCVTDYEAVYDKYKYITSGIDWGDQSHYIILGANSRKEIVLLDYGIHEHHQVLRHADDYITLNETWGVDLGVMDSGYGKSQTQHVFAARPEKAYSCFYSEGLNFPNFEVITTAKQNGEYVPLVKSEWQYKVSTDHTYMCDSVLNAIDETRLKIPVMADDELRPGISEVRGLMDNLCISKTVITEGKTSNTRRWIITKAHWFAALCYAYLAMEKVLEDAAADEGSMGFFEPRSY